MKCNRCGHEVFAEDSFQHLGETLCEDCYIDIRYPAKACDPWVVYSATRSRQSMELENADGLTDLQRAIYDFVRSNGKVTREELMKSFNLAEPKLQTQLAILRHCKLVKRHVEGDRAYLVSFWLERAQQ